MKSQKVSRVHAKHKKSKWGRKNIPWSGPVEEENGPTCRIYIPVSKWQAGGNLVKLKLMLSQPNIAEVGVMAEFGNV